MTDSPYKGVAADLIDPYFTAEAKQVGGYKASSKGADYAIWWMRRHPGRWALTAEGPVGLTKALLAIYPDIESTESSPPGRNPSGARRTYARVPHPEGESLKECLQRTKMIAVPMLTRDPFDWTPEELADAVQIARANLFPVSS